MLANSLLLLCTIAFGLEPSQVNAAELKKLQGTWETVSVETSKEKLLADKTALVSVEIENDTWKFQLRNGNQAVAKIVALDPTAKPARISLKIGDFTFHAVYRFEKDTLQVNVGDATNEPPSDFRPIESRSGGLTTYRRKAAAD